MHDAIARFAAAPEAQRLLVDGGPMVNVYLSTDANITTSDILLTTRSVSSLAAGATSAANTSVTIPSSTPVGTYFIGAIADNGNTQTETDETNNSRATTATIQVK